MKVIFPIRRYCKGAAAMNRILGYAHGFSQLGIDVWLYFFITNKYEERLSTEDPNIHVVYLWENDSHFYKKHRVLELFKNLFLFRNKIETGDTLLVYGRANYLYIIAWTLRKRSRIFCEITEHPEYQGNSLLKRLDIRLSYILLKTFNGLFVISNSLRNHFVACGLSPNKVHVINMFVDSNRFKNIKSNGLGKYIAYCGSVSRKKDGVDILIKSFARFHDSFPDYKLYIIGEKGDDEPIEYFVDLAKSLDVQKDTVFTGRISPEEMPNLLANASILALSRPNSLQAKNGFPTKLGEYLATGVPTVVTNVGEISMFIHDGINGLIAKESDVDDFAQKLIWIAKHPIESKKIGDSGKKLVEEEFSYLVQSEKVLNIINA